MTHSDLPRLGLVGAGPWARDVHLPAAIASRDVELASVWTRDPTKSAALAEAAGVDAAPSFEELLERVDIVAFAVPPAVQGELALQAARAGKHLLLEKPIAGSVEQARALAAAATEVGVATIVFFTAQLVPETRDWVDAVRAGGGAWHAETMNLSAYRNEPGNKFFDSPWRHEQGALWDLSPHEFAMLIRLLGPVESLVARRGPGDLTLVTTRHAAASGTLAVTMDAPVPAAYSVTTVSLADGRQSRPDFGDWDIAAVRASGIALEELASRARDATLPPHPIDIRLGLQVSELIDAAQRSIESGEVVALSAN